MARKPKQPNGQPLGRVLLVEDDAVLALSLEYALMDGGASEVVTSSSMQQTLVELDAGKFDIMILDVHLADRDDGWALAELVSVIGPKPPRFAFSTGSPEDIPEAIAAMGPVFEKPYDPERLVQVLRSGRKKGIFGRLRDAIVTRP